MSGIKILIAFVCGWFVAQFAKLIAAKIKGEKNLLRFLTKSGGMPSGHAASFIAASMCIGLTEGFGSAVFALAVCVAAIVLYDAINVRHAVGEQGRALNRLIPDALRVVEGHTLAEVLVGGAIGILVGMIVFFVI